MGQKQDNFIVSLTTPRRLKTRFLVHHRRPNMTAHFGFDYPARCKLAGILLLRQEYCDIDQNILYNDRQTGYLPNL